MLQTLHTLWLLVPELLEDFLGLLVVGRLEMAQTNEMKHVTSVVVLLRQRTQQLDGLARVEIVQVMQRLTRSGEQLRQGDVPKNPLCVAIQEKSPGAWSFRCVGRLQPARRVGAAAALCAGAAHAQAEVLCASPPTRGEKAW